MDLSSRETNRWKQPADLADMRSGKFELVINLETTKALDLTVPPTLAAVTDEAIESLIEPT